MPKMRTPLSCLLGVGGSATPFPGRVPIVRAMQGPIRSLDAVVQFTEPFFTGGRGPRVGVSAGRRGREPSRVLGAGRSCARRDVHFALERCISPSRCAVRSARSSAKCTSRRPGAGRAGPEAGVIAEAVIRAGARGVELSKSVAKARIEPGCRKRIVDIPRFFSPPIPARGAFATDSDTPPPRTAPRAPPASAGPLAHRFTRVCCAPFPLLRSFTLHCAPFSRTVKVIQWASGCISGNRYYDGPFP